VVREGSQFINWGRENKVDVFVDSMPLPDRSRPWESLWHAAKITWWARRAGIDVIHCNEHDVYPFAVLLKRLLMRPTICHIRYRIELLGFPIRLVDKELTRPTGKMLDTKVGKWV
jgi:hypothetical protein